MTEAHNNNVVDNAARSRFELVEEGETAFANYRLSGHTLTIPYVESPVALRGKGAAGRLLEGVVAHARENKWSIIPICGYAVAWFRRNPQHQDVLE